MSKKGTCIQTYIPMRALSNAGSEMVSSLIFGESYTILDEQNGFLKIKTDFDSYEGWISSNTYNDYIEFTQVNEFAFIEAKGDHHLIFIPCGALMPETGKFYIGDKAYVIERKLKTYHHLPLTLRIQKLATSFSNMPYLWGGRTFMGIDCSGFIQVVFKANGKQLPRDTSQQILVGTEIAHQDLKPCDLIFFSNLESQKVSHVGMVLDNGKIIHASGVVKIDDFHEDGIYHEGQKTYQTIARRRILT